MKRVLATGLVAIALFASGCGEKETADPEPVTTTAAPVTTTPIGPPPSIALVALGKFETPVAMAQRAGDSGIYVAEKTGRIRVLRDDVTSATPVLDISSEVSTEGERGLLGLAFAPNSRLFYVHYTDKSGTIHLTEFQLGENDVVDMHTRRDLLTIPHARTNHNGGQLAFGPDNYLYMGVGDGGGTGDPDKNAQNLTVLLGKILRINPKANGAEPYTIPYDNPFAKRPGARGEIWAYGLRNPWRFSFDKTKGGIWIADVGQNKWEEVNHIDKDAKGGQNYGWPLREGAHPFTGDKPAGAIDPIYEYSHDAGACSITGGYLYRGTRVEGLQGRYVFGDYCNGSIWTLTEKGTKWDAGQLASTPGSNIAVPQLVSFGQDHDGELYVLTGDGNLSRIDAA